METKTIVYSGIRFGQTFRNAQAIFEFILKEIQKNKLDIKFEFVSKSSDLDDAIRQRDRAVELLKKAITGGKVSTWEVSKLFEELGEKHGT